VNLKLGQWKLPNLRDRKERIKRKWLQPKALGDKIKQTDVYIVRVSEKEKVLKRQYLKK
jgi:hypothetical protein